MPQKDSPTSRSGVLWMAGLGLLGVVVAVGVFIFARSDSGQIDVSATISNINRERVERGEAPVAQSATRAYQNMPNGGLVPTDVPNPEPTPLSEESSTTATATEETTTDGQIENSENVEVPPEESEEENVPTEEAPVP